MCLLVSGCNAGAHSDELLNGLSIQISINLSKATSPHILLEENCCDLNFGKGLCIFTFFLFPDSQTSIYFEWRDSENQQLLALKPSYPNKITIYFRD